MNPSKFALIDNRIIDENFQTALCKDHDNYHNLRGKFHSTHEVGSGFHDLDTNFIVPIMKCGMMSLMFASVYDRRDNWSNGNWIQKISKRNDNGVDTSKEIDFYQKGFTFHVVLRDPFERWIAAMAEHTSYYTHKFSWDIMTLEELFDKLQTRFWEDSNYFDDHLLSQTTLCQSLDITRTKFYNIKYGLQELFDNTCLGVEKKTNTRDQDKYVSGKLIKKQVAEFFENMITDRDRQYVREMYAADYKLLETVFK